MSGSPDELLGLLRFVKEDPDDASRRLVLADWLEEYGSPANQVRAAVLRGQHLHLREEQLHRPTWFGALQDTGGVTMLDHWGMTFLSVSAKQCSRAPSLRHPAQYEWIASLRLFGSQERIPRDLNPFLASINQLVLSRPQERQPRLVLGREFELSRLYHLVLDAEWVPFAWNWLADVSFTPRLRHLEFPLSEWSGRMLSRLAQLPLKSLHSLVLSCPARWTRTCTPPRAPWWGQIRTLRLVGWRVEPRVLAWLLEPALVAQLQTLDLRQTVPSEQERATLAEAYGERVLFGRLPDGM